jgi:hypothetical protein
MKRIKYNILPPDGLKKGNFVLEADIMEEYARSVINWIAAIPTGIAVIQEHEHGTQELGRVVAGEWDEKTGLWAIAEFTDDMYAYVKAMNIKRVSGGFAKSFEDRRGVVHPLVMFELSLVTSPMYHDQLPPEELSVKLPMKGVRPENTVTLSMKPNIIDDTLTTYEEEPNMETNMETNEQELAAKDEEVAEAPLEDLETPEEGEEEVDPMVALQERVLALEGAIAALMKDKEEESAAEEEVAESKDEELEEDKEKEELKARLDVLRDISGKNVSGWSEDELVELKMATPRAYAKKVAEFKSVGASLSALPDINDTVSKVLGGRVDKTSISEEEAELKAMEVFKAGGSYVDTYLANRPEEG